MFPWGGQIQAFWGAGCWLSGCRAVLAGQPRKSVIGVAVETGGKPIFSQPIASLAGNALGAWGGHWGPPVFRGTQHAHGPTDPIVGLGKLRYPKWHRPLPGGCQRHPLNQPSATGCPVPLGSPPRHLAPVSPVGSVILLRARDLLGIPKRSVGSARAPQLGHQRLFWGAGGGKKKVL